MKPEDVRRKRLRFLSWHRGTREMDLLLGNFADRHLAVMTEEQLRQYEVILQVSDPELYNWIAEQEPIPAHFDTEVMSLIKNFKISYLEN